MTYFFNAGGGALPEDHPAYTIRCNLDNDAFRATIRGELLRVIAPRQVGKTSLLKRLRARLLTEGWRCAIVDLSTLFNLSMETWYAELGKLLATDLTPGAPPLLTNQISMGAYLSGEALKDAYGLPCVAVFFDEIESMMKVRNEQGQLFGDAFFLKIRDLYQNRNAYRGRLVIGLAGAVSPRHLVKDLDVSPFNVGHQLHIDDFTSDETKTFTGYLANLNVNIDDNVHESIYSWTSGHPYLTHRICSVLEQMVGERRVTTITTQVVEQVVKCTFFEPDNPMGIDSNVQHVERMLESLSEPARRKWQALRDGEAVTYGGITKEIFTDLYITGVLKKLDDILIIRNRIYQKAFATNVRSVEPVNELKMAPLLSYEPSDPTMPQTSHRFLDDARPRVIQLVRDALNNQGEFGIRNILTTCHIRLDIIDSIEYGRLPIAAIANELIWKLEGAGTLSYPYHHSHALGAFLAYLAQHELIGFDAAQEIIILIFRHNLILDKEKVRWLSCHFLIPLPVFADPSLPNGRMKMAHLPERVRDKFTDLQIQSLLESLYNRGITHYVTPRFFISGQEAMRAVCRVEFDGDPEATGFLIAPDLVLTNYHAFRPEGTSYNLDVRANRCRLHFMEARDRNNGHKFFKLHQNWCVAFSESNQLDYLLLRLAQPIRAEELAPVEIEIDTSALQEGMYVNIVHHPLGKDMAISLRCNDVVAVEPTRIYYLADTQNGSSGAPVFDDHWRVVALHRSGGEKDVSGHLLREANAGIPIKLIMQDIKQKGIQI